MTCGEQPGFDPGAQWINNLSIPGGTQRLVEPVVKFACQLGSPHTIYESTIRAGVRKETAPLELNSLTGRTSRAVPVSDGVYAF